MRNQMILAGFITLVGAPVIAQMQKSAPKSGVSSHENKAKSSAVNGKALYERYCLSCHMADGQGVQHMNPPLGGSSWVLGEKSRIIKIVLNGFNEDVAIDGQTYSNSMTAFNTLKDDEIASVLTYVRTHFGNKASVVKESEVKSVREQLGAKK